MAVVEQISRRVAVMYLGQIVEMGTPAQVLGNPRHDYTRRLLDAVPIADPTKRSSRTLSPPIEPKSLIGAKGATVPRVTLRDIGEGHLVAEA
jgi:peptide/nickel transport system ATP-binding protein